MTEPRRFAILDFLLLLGVLVTAAVPRVGYLWLCTTPEHKQGYLFVQDALPLPPEDPADQVGWKPATEPGRAELDELVENVRFDQGFICKAPFANKPEPTAHTAPGFPVLMGLLARVVDPPSLDRFVQWLQVLVGTITCGFYFLLARRAFRSTLVGLVTGVLTAIYPLWVVNTAAINDGTLITFLLAVVLFLGVRAGQSGGAFSSLLFGLMLAALALTRAYYFPFSVIALGWFLLRSRLLHWGWLCALVAFLGFVIGLAPWTVRNYQVFGEPVPVTDSAFYHLWIGNNPYADGGPVNDNEVYQATKSLEAGDVKKLADLEQPERYSRLGEIVRQTISDDRFNALKSRLMAGIYFLLGERFFSEGVFVSQVREPKKADSEQPPVVAVVPEITDKWPKAIDCFFAVALMLTLGLAFLGWRWTYGWRAESMPAALAVIFIPLPYILTHAEALHGPRLPLDGVLLCYAAFALCCFVPFVSGYLFGGAAAAKTERP
jgi:Dolichyl-phosphate-mannose-protein mannosyltransferase